MEQLHTAIVSIFKIYVYICVWIITTQLLTNALYIIENKRWSHLATWIRRKFTSIHATTRTFVNARPDRYNAIYICSGIEEYCEYHEDLRQYEDNATTPFQDWSTQSSKIWIHRTLSRNPIWHEKATTEIIDIRADTFVRTNYERTFHTAESPCAFTISRTIRAIPPTWMPISTRDFQLQFGISALYVIKILENSTIFVCDNDRVNTISREYSREPIISCTWYMIATDNENSFLISPALLRAIHDNRITPGDDITGALLIIQHGINNAPVYDPIIYPRAILRETIHQTLTEISRNISVMRESSAANHMHFVSDIYRIAIYRVEQLLVNDSSTEPRSDSRSSDRSTESYIA